ncbi:MAG: hypothetical protein Q9215_005194 [Flavoplaca cf. flavocitrina]
MKCHTLGFAALLSFGLHLHAASVHVDVSSDGDIAVDVGAKPKSFSRPERGRSGQPIRTSGKTAHKLEEYQVDLDNGIHGGVLSENGKFVTFKNIPYAEPPIGDNRFFGPIPIQKRTEGVNYGLVENVCPQAQVGWAPKAMEFLRDFPNAPALAKWTDPITAADYGPTQYPPKNARTNPADPVSEDCLTLDVVVPKSVWDSRKSNGMKAAVVAWVHGGGFVYGWKDQYGSPEGLFDAATNETEQNIIYVAMNYRLGAFGWLGGEKYLDDGGQANLGLLDQVVTMMGQDAGASSIMHHIAAPSYLRVQTQGAIVQSAGFFPQPNITQEDEKYTKFLELTGAKDVEALYTADTKILQDANAKMVHNSKYGYFDFGPTVDGYYVRDLPGKILARPDNDVYFPALLVGHEKLDGLLFTPPWIRTTEALLDYVRELFPGVPQAVLDTIASEYKIPTNLGPQASLLAVADFFDDIAIQCNSVYFTEASNKANQRTYHPVFQYVFNALPATHGYDTGYTYYPSPPIIPPVDATLAKFFQKAIVDFSRYVDPNPADVETWKPYKSDNKKVMNMGSPSQHTKPDYTPSFGDDLMNSTLCEYWRSAPWYVAPKSKGRGSGQRLVVQDDARDTFSQEL